MKGFGMKILAIDFDGTLCEDSNFPEIGFPKMKTINWVKKQQSLGHKTILNTCRESDLLKEAVNWCTLHGLIFDSINENIPELKYHPMGHRKVIADIYLDDKSMKVNEIEDLDDASNFKRSK